MTDRPIIFSAPMIRALLDGRKTQTRRIVDVKRIKPSIWFHAGIGAMTCDPSTGLWRARVGCFNCWSKPFRLPYAPGQRLWVRETVHAEELSSGADGVRYHADEQWIGISPNFEAADLWIDLHSYRKKRGATVPPRHMPRWASRLTLIVEGVKVERLQDISEADAQAEGIGEPYLGDDDPPFEERAVMVSRKMQFRNLWRSIHGPDAWAANPWVCAISFRVVKANIDCEAAA